MTCARTPLAQNDGNTKMQRTKCEMAQKHILIGAKQRRWSQRTKKRGEIISFKMREKENEKWIFEWCMKNDGRAGDLMRHRGSLPLNFVLRHCFRGGLTVGACDCIWSEYEQDNLNKMNGRANGMHYPNAIFVQLPLFASVLRPSKKIKPMSGLRTTEMWGSSQLLLFFLHFACVLLSAACRRWSLASRARWHSP